MSLTARLTLSFAALILALGVAAFFGVRMLTADLTNALGETAASVSRAVVTVLRSDSGSQTDGKSVEEHSVDGNQLDGDQVDGDPADQSAESTRYVGLEVETINFEGLPQFGERHVELLADGRTRDVDARTAADGKEVFRVVIEGDDAEIDADAVALDAITQRLQKMGAPQVEFRQSKDGEAPQVWLKDSDSNSVRRIPLPRSGLDSALDRFQQRLGLGLLMLLTLGVAAAALLARRLSRPLAQLADAAQSVGAGARGVQVVEQGPPELRRSLAAFNRMSADLERLDREAEALRADRELAELGDIGRGLAHGLRNPLHALGLSLEALASQAPPAPEVQALAAAGRAQLARIDQALRGFLALAAGAGSTSESIALREVIDDVVLEASQRAAGRVRFVRELDATCVVGVAAELRILLHTLVVNALEASPDGGSVLITLRADDADVLIAVEDEGAGIPSTVRERLFSPHVSSKPTGAGMGLYLAQRLVRLRYGGSIELLDRAASGTRAELRFGDRLDHPAKDAP